MTNNATAPLPGIRARLTELTLVMFGVPLLVAIVLIGWFMHGALMNSLVDRLTSDTAALVAVVTVEGPEQSQVHEVLGPDAQRVTVLIENEAGEPVLEHPSPEHTVPSPPDLGPAFTPVVSGTDNLPWLGTDSTPVTVTQDTVHRGHTYRITVADQPVAEVSAVRAVVLVLLATFPFLLLGLGIATWVTVGRALRPVEEMRAAAERISTQQLSDRLPVPTHDDELGRLTLTLNAMLERLEAGHVAQQQFVSDASHELRSPLAGLRTAIQLGRASGTAKRWNELAPIMDHESLRLTHLVEDLLVLSRSDERGGLHFEPEEVDLDDVAHTEVTSLDATDSVTVTCKVTGCRVLGDPQALARLTRNLVQNAVNAAASRVHVSVACNATWAWLRVDDDGPGIPPDEREHVFERFVRLDEARQRDRGGSGLGLTIVAEIARAHDGTVTVTDSPELGGARLEVMLPVAPT